VAQSSCHILHLVMPSKYQQIHASLSKKNLYHKF